MNSNPYYVQPGGNITPGLQGISRSMDKRREIDASEQSAADFKQAQTAAVEAYRSGDPDRVAEFVLQNPQFAKTMSSMTELRSEKVKTKYGNALFDVIQNPSVGGVKSLAEYRSAVLGAGPENDKNTDELVEMYEQDPKKAVEQLKMDLAWLAPEKWAEYQKSTGGKGGKSLPKQKTGAFLIKDPETQETSIAVGSFDTETGTLTTETAAIDGADIVSKLGETAGEQTTRKVGEAGKVETVKGAEKRASSLIDRGLLAAESSATIRRGIELLDMVETGGIDNVQLIAKRVFGVEGADEGELSQALGKAVLSQLRETFGAQFTQEEGNRLIRLEAGFGKSVANNRRLLKQSLRIVERTAKRARKSAEKRGDQDTVDDINELLSFSLSTKPPTEGPQEVTTQEQFDALPSGTVYLENGQQYRKP